MNGFHDREPDVRGRAHARLLASTGGDGNHAGGACDFDVVVRGSRIKARALEPDVVAHIAEGLIIEDECGDPALEVRSGGDAHRASNENLRCPPADPYGDRKSTRLNSSHTVISYA